MQGHGNFKSSRTPCSVHELQNPSSILQFTAPGSTTILVSPRKCQASLLLLFRGYSITLSTSGILIFLETPNATAPPGFLLARYLSYENLELSDSPVLLALS